MKLVNRIEDEGGWRTALASDRTSFYYQPEFLEYVAALPGFEADRSFLLQDGGHVVAAVPVTARKEAGIRLGSYGPCPLPVPRRLAARLDEGDPIWEALDRRCEEEKLDAVVLFDPRPIVPDRISPVAARRGFWPCPLERVVIERAPWEVLLSHMSQDRRRMLRRTTGIRVELTAQKQFPEHVVAFRRIKHEEAGRELWSSLVWDHRFHWLLIGRGILVAASLDAEPVAYAYFVADGGAARLMWMGMTAGARARGDVGVVLVGRALEILFEEFGFPTVELGVVQRGPLPYDAPSPKEVGIAAFWLQFGGDVLPLLRWAKAYTRAGLAYLIEQPTAALRETLP